MTQFSSTRISRSANALAFVLIAMLAAVCQVSAQTEQKLYDFCSELGCTDGAFPNGALIMDKKGNLFGTTTSGGAHGEGTVFEINASGIESVLYSFCSEPSCADGANPFDGLTMDKKGNLYGTTYLGGAHGEGAVFKISALGESVLYSFCSEPSCADGANPYAGLTMDKTGNLFGTTLGGGSLNNGTVFELSTTGTETVLHRFENTPDFATPYGGVTMDKKGNLYGTTWFGGANGSGGVYEISVDQTETRLYDNWCAFPCTQDGDSSAAALILDKKGNLFGTSAVGGAFAHGLVFQINIKRKKEMLLYSFAGVPDGAVPFAGLIRDNNGNFYGTTTAGGVSGCTGGIQVGCGTVFELSPSGTESILHSFVNDANDGVNPYGGLIMDAQGNLDGTTRLGGPNNGGTVFRITP